MAKAPFTLSRATRDDVPEISELQFNCFDEWIRKIFMGCHSHEDLIKVEQRHAHTMETDPNDVWVKVVDKKTNRIVAASNWKVHINGQSNSRSEDTPPEGLNGAELEKSREIMEEFNARRAKANPGPFIHLHICFTSNDYRRRGAGGMMMKWGCDLADLLGIPGWIEASPEGNFLYKTYGFYDYEKIEGEMAGGTNMRRDPKPLAFAGGK